MCVCVCLSVVPNTSSLIVMFVDNYCLLFVCTSLNSVGESFKYFAHFRIVCHKAHLSAYIFPFTSYARNVFLPLRVLRCFMTRTSGGDAGLIQWTSREEIKYENEDN